RLPGATVVRLAGAKEVAAAVCRGEVESGVLGDGAAQSVDFGKPADCNLRMSPIAGARFWSGIGASKLRPDAARIADLLREQLGVMVRDGFYSTVCLKWYGRPTNEAMMVELVTQAEAENRQRNTAVAALALFSALLLWMAWRLHLARRSAERATAAKSEFL